MFEFRLRPGPRPVRSYAPAGSAPAGISKEDGLRPDSQASLTVELIPGEGLDAAPALELELLSPERAIEAGIHTTAYMGAPGKAPRINADDFWEVYDNESGAWLDTGVYARGRVESYAQLEDRPRINGNELIGDKTASQLGLENRIGVEEIEAMFREGEG